MDNVLTQDPAAAFTAKMTRVAVVIVATLYWFILLKNAWLCDDFWISARQIEQLFAGNGLRWNPHERIQLFTGVLGFFFLILVRFFTTDFFLIYAVQAIFFNALLLVLLYKLLQSAGKWCAAVLLLAASNSFMDFTWSGLHNFIGHVLLIAFLIYWYRLFAQTGYQDTKHRNYWLLFVVAGIAPLFRHDFTLVVWPAAGYALWIVARQSRTQALRYAVVMFGPLFLWTLFSLLYFGFPLPMTAYLKLGSGFPRSIWITNGLHYFSFSWRNDAIVLFLMLAALGWLAWRGGRSGRPLAVGLGLSLFYVLYTGADYMGGRFFTYAYLLAVVTCAGRWEEITALRKVGYQQQNTSKHFIRRSIALVSFALIWMLVYPATPLKGPLVYTKTGFAVHSTGISDERAVYHSGTRILDYLAYRRGEIDIYPYHASVRIGKIIARSNLPVIHLCDIGMGPFNARLDQKLIDIYGYSDVLQARLPGINTRPGHIVRSFPQGYLESIAAGDERIEDPTFNDYYKSLRLITQSDEIFSKARLAAIVEINLSPRPQLSTDIIVPTKIKLPLLCDAKEDIQLLMRLDEEIESIGLDELNSSNLYW